MLWYKAWLETRMRFVICLIGITALSAYNLYRMDHEVTSPVNAAFYNNVINRQDGQLAVLWLLAFNLLAMGGLLREKTVGAASFTLALPFSRARLTIIRMAMSLAQAMTLLIIPWGAIILMGDIFRNTQSVSQALFHLALLTGGGILLYAIAFLVSTVIEGEYTAPMASGGITLAIAFEVGGPSLLHYNPVAFMMGGEFYDAHAGLLRGPFPWTQIVFFCSLAAPLLFLSVKSTQRREF
jgi:ABC-2 type transport system permease protein